MGFKKLGFPLLVIMVILFQLHLLPLHAHPLQNTSTTIALHQEPNARDIKVNGDKGMTRKLAVTTGLKQIATVDRRGGGGGGHGGGGHASHGGHSTGSSAHGGEATRGNGNEGYKHGATVVPLYAAGAMAHHQNNHQHGSNKGTLNYVSPSYLVLVALAVSIIQYFA